jgi:hypothetical protein
MAKNNGRGRNGRKVAMAELEDTDPMTREELLEAFGRPAPEPGGPGVGAGLGGPAAGDAGRGGTDLGGTELGGTELGGVTRPEPDGVAERRTRL